MRKPNYNMERKDRERAKQAKAAAKAEKRAAKGAEDRAPDASMPQDDIRADKVEGGKQES
ncbi:hypothetical protein [Falsiroseomonas bella]|nr:hypothetical protein [Falsiroseomonas bella]